MMGGKHPFPPSIYGILIQLLLFSPLSLAWRPWHHEGSTTAYIKTGGKLDDPKTLSVSKRFEGSSDLVNLPYHMGPVLTDSINVYIIWYGDWTRPSQQIVRDFIHSISPKETTQESGSASSTVAKWWRTARLYTDQTDSNISGTVHLSGEYHDRHHSLGKSLTRLSVQSVIRNALQMVHYRGVRIPVDPQNGIYLVLTSPDVEMQDFCLAVCGFHFFTFPSIVGYILPYAWVGNSATQCPDTCAFPFSIPSYMSGKTEALRPPNGDVAVDGMISVIGHELAELSPNPLINAWYAGDDPIAPTEIADLCEGIYGSGGGGGYIGQVTADGQGHHSNMAGVAGRRFMVQWLWSPVANSCVGPNALD